MSDVLAHKQLKRLTHLIPSIRSAVADGRLNLGGVQITSDGWVGVTDGHRLARVRVDSGGMIPAVDLSIDGLMDASKGEGKAWEYLRNGERFGGQVPSLGNIKPDGLLQHWTVVAGAEEALLKIVKHRQAEYRSAREAWVEDYAAQARDITARTKIVNADLKAALAAAGDDKKAKADARRIHGLKRSELSRDRYVMQASRKETEPNVTFGVKLVQRAGELYAESELGPALIAVEASVTRSGVTIGMDAGYLAVALKAMRGARDTIVSTSRDDHLTMIKVSPYGEEAYALIMPMRL